jgi:hypothetical protein
VRTIVLTFSRKINKEIMTFEEIFKEKGTYQAESFIKGFCFEVDSDGWLYSLHYRDENDVNPIRERAVIGREIFNKNFVVVYNRNQLFK